MQCRFYQSFFRGTAGSDRTSPERNNQGNCNRFSELASESRNKARQAQLEERNSVRMDSSVLKTKLNELAEQNVAVTCPSARQPYYLFSILKNLRGKRKGLFVPVP